MASCCPIKQPIRAVSIGDMRHRLFIFNRDLKPPPGNAVDYALDFTLSVKLWGYIETVTGISSFDNTNIERTVSHRIWVRFLQSLTEEKWIVYNNGLEIVYYDIVKVESIDERRVFMRLLCNERGTITLPTNEA